MAVRADHSGGLDNFSKAAILLLVLAFAYTVVRAAAVPISHDEAITYLISKGQVREIIINNDTLHPTNNHILNTLLIKASTSVFGISEIAIRLPVLFGHALYLYAIYDILRRFLRKHLLVLGTAVLSFNPFLIDFFSCARGYGLALGFFAIGISFLLRPPEHDRNEFKNHAFALAMLMLATLSNLSFLNMLLTALILLFIREADQLVKEKIARPRLPILASKSAVNLLLIILVGIFTIAIFLPQLANVLYYRDTYYGEKSGFIEGTVKTVVDYILYGKEYAVWAAPLAQYFSLAVMLFAALLVLGKRFGPSGRQDVPKRTTTKYDGFDMFKNASIFLLAFILLTYALNIIANAGYPMGRAAIYLVPIFFILMLSAWAKARETGMLARKAIDAFFIISSSLILFHYFMCLNITYFEYVDYDASSKDAMLDVIGYVTENNLSVSSARIGTLVNYEPALNFYREKYEIPWLEKVSRLGYDMTYDFYYLPSDEKGNVSGQGLKLVKKYPFTKTYLFARPPAWFANK